MTSVKVFLTKLLASTGISKFEVEQELSNIDFDRIAADYEYFVHMFITCLGKTETEILQRLAKIAIKTSTKHFYANPFESLSIPYRDELHDEINRQLIDNDIFHKIKFYGFGGYMKIDSVSIYLQYNYRDIIPVRKRMFNIEKLMKWIARSSIQKRISLNNYTDLEIEKFVNNGSEQFIDFYCSLP
jgi:hypothetical protein